VYVKVGEHKNIECIKLRCNLVITMRVDILIDAIM